MARRKKRKLSAPTTTRLREDVEIIIAGYQSLTGWSASECINWLIRAGREAIEGNTKHAAAVRTHMGAAALRHRAEQEADAKLAAAKTRERETAKAITPAKQPGPSDFQKPKP